MPCYMHWYCLMDADITGISRFQLKVIIHVLSIHRKVRGLMETMENITDQWSDWWHVFLHKGLFRKNNVKVNKHYVFFCWWSRAFPWWVTCKWKRQKVIEVVYLSEVQPTVNVLWVKTGHLYAMRTTARRSVPCVGGVVHVCVEGCT